MPAMPSSIQKKVHSLLCPAVGDSQWDKKIDTFLITLVLLNVIAVILESVDELFLAYKTFFEVFEYISVIIFSIEYVFRVWTCTCIEKYKHPVLGRLKYIFSPSALVDLVAILPFYLPQALFYDLRFVRIFRLFRFLRLFKLGRYLNASKVIGNVFYSKKEELVLCFMLTLSLIVVASSLMYFVEHDAQPDKFSSIPAAMWWSVTTLTTVGYGDVFPITPIGRFLTACISMLGIGLFALPAGILASGFSTEFQRVKKGKRVCPHCEGEL
jgi:voltage-gated potassium channel